MGKSKPGTKFDPAGVDEVSLDLVQDAEKYTDKMFMLLLIDGFGNKFQVVLDGVQVGDIIADARDCGLPADWPYPDGVPRIKNRDGSWALPNLPDPLSPEAKRTKGDGTHKSI